MLVLNLEPRGHRCQPAAFRSHLHAHTGRGVQQFHIHTQRHASSMRHKCAVLRQERRKLKVGERGTLLRKSGAPRPSALRGVSLQLCMSNSHPPRWEGNCSVTCWTHHEFLGTSPFFGHDFAALPSKLPLPCFTRNLSDLFTQCWMVSTLNLTARGRALLMLGPAGERAALPFFLLSCTMRLSASTAQSPVRGIWRQVAPPKGRQSLPRHELLPRH